METAAPERPRFQIRDSGHLGGLDALDGGVRDSARLQPFAAAAALRPPPGAPPDVVRGYQLYQTTCKKAASLLGRAPVAVLRVRDFRVGAAAADDAASATSVPPPPPEPPGGTAGVLRGLRRNKLLLLAPREAMTTAGKRALTQLCDPSKPLPAWADVAVSACHWVDPFVVPPLPQGVTCAAVRGGGAGGAAYKHDCARSRCGSPWLEGEARPLLRVMVPLALAAALEGAPEMRVMTRGDILAVGGELHMLAYVMATYRWCEPAAAAAARGVTCADAPPAGSAAGPVAELSLSLLLPSMMADAPGEVNQTERASFAHPLLPLSQRRLAAKFAARGVGDGGHDSGHDAGLPTLRKRKPAPGVGSAIAEPEGAGVDGSGTAAAATSAVTNGKAAPGADVTTASRRRNCTLAAVCIEVAVEDAAAAATAPAVEGGATAGTASTTTLAVSSVAAAFLVGSAPTSTVTPTASASALAAPVSAPGGVGLLEWRPSRRAPWLWRWRHPLGGAYVLHVSSAGAPGGGLPLGVTLTRGRSSLGETSGVPWQQRVLAAGADFFGRPQLAVAVRQRDVAAAAALLAGHAGLRAPEPVSEVVRGRGGDGMAGG